MRECNTIANSAETQNGKARSCITHFERMIVYSDRKIHTLARKKLYFCLKKRVRSDRMVKTPKKADEYAKNGEKATHESGKQTQQHRAGKHPARLSRGTPWLARRVCPRKRRPCHANATAREASGCGGGCPLTRGILGCSRGRAGQLRPPAGRILRLQRAKY